MTISSLAFLERKAGLVIFMLHAFSLAKMRQILRDLRTRNKVLIACHSFGRTTVFIFIVKSLEIHIDIYIHLS